MQKCIKKIWSIFCCDNRNNNNNEKNHEFFSILSLKYIFYDGKYVFYYMFLVQNTVNIDVK